MNTFTAIVVAKSYVVLNECWMLIAYLRQSWKIPWPTEATVSFILDKLFPEKNRNIFSTTDIKIKNGNICRFKQRMMKSWQIWDSSWHFSKKVLPQRRALELQRRQDTLSLKAKQDRTCIVDDEEASRGHHSDYQMSRSPWWKSWIVHAVARFQSNWRDGLPDVWVTKTFFPLKFAFFLLFCQM